MKNARKRDRARWVIFHRECLCGMIAPAVSPEWRRAVGDVVGRFDTVWFVMGLTVSGVGMLVSVAGLAVLRLTNPWNCQMLRIREVACVIRRCILCWMAGP